MPDLTITAGLSFSAHLITAGVMTILLFGCYRQYRKAYVRHWTLSWAALAATQTFIFITLAAAVNVDVGPRHPFRLGPAMVAAAAAFLHVGWLAFGTWELVRRRPVRLRESKGILYALGVCGALSVFVPVNVYAALSGCALAIMAASIWRTRRLRAGFGSVILGLALALHAVQRLAEAAESMTSLPAGIRPEMPASWPFVDLLLLSLIGLGMIASLLEDEREAAAIAADQVEHLAYHDALTGLPNRPLFMDRLIIALAQANRAQQKLAVIFLDLDRFRPVECHAEADAGADPGVDVGVEQGQVHLVESGGQAVAPADPPATREQVRLGERLDVPPHVLLPHALPFETGDKLTGYRQQVAEDVRAVLGKLRRGVALEDVDVFGVTAGPGLIGALLVGVCWTKAISYGRLLSQIVMSRGPRRASRWSCRASGCATPRASCSAAEASTGSRRARATPTCRSR